MVINTRQLTVSHQSGSPKNKNRSIQEFIKSECKRKKKIDELTFCVALFMLVNQQKQAVEMALLGLRDYKLKDEFKHLESRLEWEARRAEEKGVGTVSESYNGRSVV